MAAGASLTPLIEQYEGVKARYPGHLVLFRVGDFYETFGDDAKLLSRELEVVLTARGPDTRGERLPMAGVPHHAIDGYLARLVGKGYKVALCDQVEDARFAKGLVRREVTRVVTPGTVIEDRILPGAEYNFLVAVRLISSKRADFAAVDISTGDLIVGEAPTPDLDGLLGALAPLAPREVLVLAAASPDSAATVEAALRREFPTARVELRPRAASRPELPPPLAASEAVPSDAREVVECLVAYVADTQPRLLPYLEPVPFSGVRRLRLDAKSLRHLEITKPMNPDDPRGPTLLSTWDATVTATGRRTLSFWLRNPLADAGAIRARQDLVEALLARGAALDLFRRRLARVADLARIAARLVARRLRPGELGVLRDSLAALAEAHRWLDESDGASPLAVLARRLDLLPDLYERLAKTLPDESEGEPEGPRFRAGAYPDVDRLRAQEESALADLEKLEREEQARTAIRTLKIGYNQVFGYFFEVSRPNLGRVPADYRRKQTLSGAERFTSDRLAEVEERVLRAQEELSRRHAELWERFLTELESYVPRVHRLSRVLGETDALQSFAHVARERTLVRPRIDESHVLDLREGRHPVLDQTLSGRFVPNDTELDADEGRLLVLTGPNMSGKSTYMRQVGLIVVLAQAGAFVPAKHARVGVVSALYTRMGFTDEIGRGKSSFMVEMTEVAEILRSADPAALVLLDEVGRGTSTFDGLAIAWATLRYLHDSVRCRTVLATHYHQLTELVAGLPHARNAHLAVQDERDELVFLYRLVPGSTDRSYGLHVARLAELPSPVLREAERVLRQLEREGVGLSPSGTGRERAPVRYTQGVLLPAESAAPSPVEEALRRLNPNELSPIQAWQWLAEWRRRLGSPAAPEDS